MSSWPQLHTRLSECEEREGALLIVVFVCVFASACAKETAWGGGGRERERAAREKQRERTKRDRERQRGERVAETGRVCVPIERTPPAEYMSILHLSSMARFASSTHICQRF